MENTTDDPGRRVRKRLQTLQLLAQTACSLFEKHGYDAVTMEQIAEQTDVAKRTLYNHFPTKEAVLAYWLDAELARDLVNVQKEVAKRTGFVARVWCVLNASAQWSEKHPDYLLAYLRHRFIMLGNPQAEGDGSHAHDVALIWHQLIAEGQREGELSRKFPAAQLATAFHHLYLGALLRWLHEPALSLQKELQAVVKLFVDGATEKSASKAGARTKRRK